ncbi:MAG: hypothetical protein R6U98_32505, partial [Pirellulaceae bacterium]
ERQDTFYSQKTRIASGASVPDDSAHVELQKLFLNGSQVTTTLPLSHPFSHQWDSRREITPPIGAVKPPPDIRVATTCLWSLQQHELAVSRRDPHDRHPHQVAGGRHDLGITGKTKSPFAPRKTTNTQVISPTFLN